MDVTRMQEEQCYMCTRIATSVEHVPPKCLFPEIKDSGNNYRKNLITVPSCDEHNEKKSHDDEFLMVSIAGILGNNSIGYEHYHGKVQRAIKRSSYKLLKKAFIKGEIFRISDNNKFIDILWGTPDHSRLLNCFEHIAHGVYKHHFKSSFNGSIKTLLHFIHPSEKNPQNFKKFIEHRASIDLEGKAIHGENKGVFYYQLTDPDQFGLFIAKLCFYQNVNIYICFQPSGTELPKHLGYELMNLGIKTFITVGDKEYEFN